MNHPTIKAVDLALPGVQKYSYDMTIQRYPIRKNETLQGWDSADELILEHMKGLSLSEKRILIVNDHFGALSCGLIEHDCTTYTDSFVSMRAIELNSHSKVSPISDLNALKGYFDFVLIQIPKNMSYFEDILCRLTHHLRPDSKVICGSMVKHLAPTSFDLLNKYIGTTSTSLAQKKARLVFASFEKSVIESPYPQKLELEGFKQPFINHSNLFSRDKLDIGTRFFLEHIPQGNFDSILDLGCANGIIGIKAKLLNPTAHIVFSDDSAMAIASASENYKTFFAEEAQYHWLNCFEGQPKNFLDLVLCNPPFHQGHTIGDFIAWQMFQDSFAALKPGGKILVIGNSHLGYQVKLKKLFGNSKIIATNAKFIICESEKKL
jgi:23S rRNA (guanine1835-N2)-methyltransferase